MTQASATTYSVSPAERRRRFPTGLAKHALVLLGLVALVDSAVLGVVGRNQPLGGDGPYYVDLARSLASGRGYVAPHGPWPTQPHLSRLPLWPAILSVPMFLFPNSPSETVARYTGVAMVALGAVCIFGLTWILGGSIAFSWFAALCAALHPATFYLLVSGACETAAMCVLAMGTLFLVIGGRWLLVGAAVLGLMPLVRPNFVLLPACIALAAWLLFRHRIPWSSLPYRALAIACVLFSVPSGAWITRNYLITGRFPFLSALEGEGLYGSYNVLTARELEYWGYWVFPNLIPQEVPKQTLAKHMSELALNDYYHRKGVAYIREHWQELPRLILGRLIRGFVPIPWKPLLPSYVVFAFRAALYITFLICIRSALRSIPVEFGVVVIGSILCVLTTTILYYGTYRFAYPIESMLLPFSAIGAGAFRHKTFWLRRDRC